MDLNKKQSIKSISKLKSIDFFSLDLTLINVIVDDILKISNDKIDDNYSWFEVNLNDKNESIYIILNNKNCLQIELTVFENTIDMLVGKEKEPIYEMYLVKEYSKFKSTFQKWFNNNIFQKSLESKNGIIFNSFYTESGKVLHESINFSFIFKMKKEFKYSNFKSWI